jgi:Uma2 family endonuclease
MTADELFRMPDDNMRHELVRGKLTTMPPAGWEHGMVSVKFGSLLLQHVEANKLGYVCGAETGFKIFSKPDTVRAPDAAFIAAGRFPPGPMPRNYPAMAPDLVVEVMSPGDTAREVREKVQDWLEAGARLVWTASLRARSVTEYRPGAEPRVLEGDDLLDGGDVVPGFTCGVRDLFPEAS